MSQNDDLEQRVTTLEAEQPLIRQEAAAARALAAGADRDVAEYRAELRSHTRVLSALRETQLEHYAELRGTQLEQKALIEQHYAEHKADSVEIKAGLAHIVRLLEGLDSSRPD